MLVYAVVDTRLGPDHPLAGVLSTYLRRDDAEQLIAELRADDPELAANLRIVERDLSGDSDPS